MELLSDPSVNADFENFVDVTGTRPKTQPIESVLRAFALGHFGMAAEAGRDQEGDRGKSETFHRFLDEQQCDAFTEAWAPASPRRREPRSRRGRGPCPVS